jgi:hypothetical protein
MVDVLFALCEYLLPHLGRNGWEEQAELINKENHQPLPVGGFYCVNAC